MILTADSGSTKTTWMVEHEGWKQLFHTQGLNPFYMTEAEMQRIIGEELLRQELFPAAQQIEEVRFYGAGCTKEKSPLLRGVLLSLFPSASSVEVGSDMLGAAKALLGGEEGIACILGTGANSCLYDGKEIVANVSPMGFIVGDEGSGAVLGKTFVNLLYKGGHDDMVETFQKETGLTQPAIIQRVYREATPNRFLASLAPFVRRHTDEEWIEEMVVECFRLFFKRNVAHYNRKDLACSFVGSIAFHFERELRIAANKEGYKVGRIIKEPLFV